ncbi:MAG: hypothetical protein PHY02_10870 [Phycisphaerae bacterium]|nr:hypothetical protein [Phycisphaerae bacterium]
MQDARLYQKVYFRIDSGYVWGQGQDKAETDRVFAECKAIFEPMGFTLKKPYKSSMACPEYVRGVERLYCHPMDFSGWLAQDNIPAIERAIKQSEYWEWRKTDTFDTAYNYTIEELSEELNKLAPQVSGDILTAYTTKRKNLVKTVSVLYDLMQKKYISYVDTIEGHKNLCQNFVKTVFNDLLRDGKITQSQCKAGTGYRKA